MKPAVVVAVCFLFLIALAHLARIVFDVALTVGSVEVPMWPSVLATVGPGALAVWLWREGHE